MVSVAASLLLLVAVAPLVIAQAAIGSPVRTHCPLKFILKSWPAVGVPAYMPASLTTTVPPFQPSGMIASKSIPSVFLSVHVWFGSFGPVGTRTAEAPRAQLPSTSRLRAGI